jgi:ribosome maturation factor RimP
VGVQYHASRNRSLLRVYIDRAAGITLDDCARVSHQVSGVLDVEDPITGEYDLEVSSPGLDRPLFSREHFERFGGQRARVTLEAPIEGRRRFTGELGGVRGDAVSVWVDGEEYLLPFDAIASARLTPDGSE